MPKRNFLILSFLLQYLISILSNRKSLPPHLSPLCQYRLMNSYFFQWFVICYYLYFDVQNIPNLPIGSPFKLVPMSFLCFWQLNCCFSGRMEFWSSYSTIFGDDTPSSYVILTCHHYSLSALLILNKTKYSRFTLPSPAPTLGSAISPRSSAFFRRRMLFRNQDLGAECAHCCWDVIALGLLIR